MFMYVGRVYNTVDCDFRGENIFMLKEKLKIIFMKFDYLMKFQ